MDFNFAAESNISDSYDSMDEFTIGEIKNSDEYKELDLINSQKDRNEAARMLEPEGDFWLATLDGLYENS